jgi:hypothetical protein
MRNPKSMLALRFSSFFNAEYETKHAALGNYKNAHEHKSNFFGVWIIYGDHSGRAVKGMNCLRPLVRWAREFESHLRRGCLCAFILFVLSCVQVAALRWADPPFKESYDCVKDEETEKAAKAQQGAVDA